MHMASDKAHSFDRNFSYYNSSVPVVWHATLDNYRRRKADVLSYRQIYQYMHFHETHILDQTPQHSLLKRSTSSFDLQARPDIYWGKDWLIIIAHSQTN